MATEVWRVNALEPEPHLMKRAGDILRRGGLVAFPTETVYGLGANALDAEAVARIFEAKGRPASNPVIVHVADFAQMKPLVEDWLPAVSLGVEFWPGPLTLVMRKAACIPDIVTAGGPTVAVRVPSHPVALALLRAAGVPIAAPSANRSTCLSPTRAEHVLNGLDGRIDLLLDGGPAYGGLESTVVDVSTVPATILRPGLISRVQIESMLGPITERAKTDEIARSPGMMERHYSPRTPLFLTTDARVVVERLRQAGERVAWLAFGDDGPDAIAMPTDPAAYASQLYEVLHRLDAAGFNSIVVALPPVGEEWMAVHDRLKRASS